MMLIEEQFDREKQGSGATVFDDLLPEERSEVINAIQTLLDHAGDGTTRAMRVFLGFMHKVYMAPCMESRLGMEPIKAFTLNEAALAQCKAVIDIIEMTTGDGKALISVLENLTQE